MLKMRKQYDIVITSVRKTKEKSRCIKLAILKNQAKECILLKR